MSTEPAEDVSAPSELALKRPLLRRFNGDERNLMGVNHVNKMFPVAANLALLVYVVLLYLVYSTTPRDQWAYLPEKERQAAFMAFLILVVANTLIMSRFAFQRKWKQHMNGIVYASNVNQVVAMATNLILAYMPTVVMVDPITHSRVFLVRWCEWIPLAGLMTFFSEGVGVGRTNESAKYAILSALSQSFSCLSGLFAPYCAGIISWSINICFAFATYLVIFQRVSIMRQKYLEEAKKHRSSFIEKEHFDRARFSYELMLTCSIIWTFLVVMYFINMAAHRLLPEHHYLRHESLAMITDTTFDVIGKAMYPKLIMDVYFAVFDAEGRAHRQLGELRNLVSVLWDSSSDAIVISAQNGGRATSMLSPAFLKLVDVALPPDIRNRRAVALLIETERSEPEDNPQVAVDIVSSSLFVDCSEMPSGGLFDESVLAEVSSSSPNAIQASGLVAAAWNHALKSESEHALLYQLHDRKCEVKVSLHSENTIVAVVRDVTERYKRMEAERKAHLETVARQKDAQSQTRFVRHEVKNGLLAGIELCDSLRNAIEDLERSVGALNGLSRESSDDENTETTGRGGDVAASSVTPPRSRRLMEELDVTLHEILDTVLAEAMARDVIHEVYHPRSERIDVVSLFTNTGSKAGKGERFPVVSTRPDIPYLMLDPQLLRYIHRNAVSNACKYGKQGGDVVTKICYDIRKRQFQMQVINEPGPGHDHLLTLGDNASELVFAQGSMLHSDADYHSSYISAGDGAWIMQKCAKTMRGVCSIEFKKDQTVFTFCCPAEPLTVVEWPETQDFQVPSDTWGVAIDDSNIQRKLMARILGHVGIDESKRIVLGASPAEVFGVERVISDLIASHPTSRVLVLVDENLDFGESDGEPVILSGSLVMKEILASMTPEQESKLFVLVRSANDSADDVALYTSRTHGFFPKAPMQRQRIRELLAPLWAERFLRHDLIRVESVTGMNRSSMIVGCKRD